MKLLRWLISLLLLRRLPFGCLTNWIVRFALWAGIAVAVSRALKPRDAQNAQRGLVSQPSGWTSTTPTAPPAAAESHSETLSVTVQREWEEQGETVVETITETVQDRVEVWGTPTEETGSVDEPSRPQTPWRPTWVEGDGSFDCPTDYPIKAKLTSLIFHIPGSRHYDATIPDVCYATAEDAVAAGYRPPLR